MNAPAPLAEYRFGSGPDAGTHFTLFPGRLLHEGGNVVEHIPLNHLAALRIEFLREQSKLKSAIILLAVAVLLVMVSSPLQNMANLADREVAEHAKREGVPGGVSGVLQLSFRAIERGAAALPTLAFGFFAWAAVLLAFWFWGRTVLTLSLAAVEREYSVRGRDRSLMAFADAISQRLGDL